MFSSNSSQVADDKLYIEDVFSTYLYTGNGSTQTITNGIDLAGKGGMVWTKNRTTASSPQNNHRIYDTARGMVSPSNALISNTTDAQNGLSVFSSVNSNGFTLGGGNPSASNVNGEPYASWTFREAPKFFDVVTWTGTGANRNIAHNLGVAPGCIIVKRTDTTGDWQVYHRSNANTQYMVLNSTAAVATGTTRWNSTTPTSTEFTVGTDASVNASGGTYVAYLFAHDATSDGIIQCGSYTGTGSAGNFVNLGWEPQWVLIKDKTYGDDWYIYDNMRGASLTRQSWLWANKTTAELSAADSGPSFGATGFTAQSTSRVNGSGSTYIYIAIRRGPMRTPTSGTSVFAATATSAASGTTITTNFPVDLNTVFYRDGADSANTTFMDRLRGLPQNSSDTTSGKVIRTSSTAAEITNTSPWFYTFDNTGWKIGGGGGLNYLYYSFRRAPSFFDVVCYNATGGTSLSPYHSLGVMPELIIQKVRNGTSRWQVTRHTSATNSDYGYLSETLKFNEYGTVSYPVSTTQFYSNPQATAGQQVVAYLFASCPGVSKVGSYTGNGSSQTINCGFAAGARFVMIKRTDGTGNWLVADSARGIVAGNDPLLYLNSTAAEVTTLDWIDADASGFIVNQDATANANVNGATYIYLAIS